MGPFELLNHLLNFAAPAVAVALCLALAGRFVVRPAPGAPRWWVLAGVDCAVGVAVLLGGLVVFGVDGKLSTYLLLVGAMATTHWLALRGWRR